MKTTRYFDSVKLRPDRASIQDDWVLRIIDNPEHTIVQADGRIRLWAKVPEMDNRYLRVILLEDGETIHNVFFDRSFAP